MAEDGDDTNQLIFMEHWDGENTAIAAERDGRDDEWIALDISPFQRYVGDLDHLLRLCRTPYTCVGGWMHDPRPRLLISGWRVVHRSGAEAVALAEVKRTELGLADAGCVLEHGLEHGLQLARGTADDFQHIGGRGLLLQRFTQIVGAFAQFLEQPRVLDRDHHLFGEIAQQLDLLLGERPDLLSIDRDRADQFGVLEHRNNNDSTGSGVLN